MVIIGLGNPDKKYENTYHNVGFNAVDYIADKLGVNIDSKECKSLVGVKFVGGEKVALAKPLTYMNLSGEAIRELKGKYKEPVIVICDDIDLPFSKLRVREKGSAGTHNGLRNIVYNVGEDFIRIRIGIGRDEKFENLADFVLSRIPSDRLSVLNDKNEKIAKAVIEYISHRDCNLLMRTLNG